MRLTPPLSTLRATVPRATLMVRGLRDLLFPAACVSCEQALDAREADVVCGACRSRIVPLTFPTCERCGHPRLSPNAPLPREELQVAAPLPSCRWCHRLPPWVRTVRSACRMDMGTGAALVHALKYEGWTRVANTMAACMARVPLPTDVIAERTALLPVPLSRVRQRERGYNQAELLAEALGRHWHLPVWRHTVSRTRNTRSQVQLTPSERTGNVAQAFAASPGTPGPLAGAHVVLVDDVITTAATMNAVGEVLIRRGARIVSYITFGRAPEPGDRSVPDLDSLLE